IACIIAAIIFPLFLSSCQEEFNPVSNFKDQYVVNGVINYDYAYSIFPKPSTEQNCECRVFISRSFNLVNNMAMIDSGNALIRGASVSLMLNNGTSYTLQDKDSKGNLLNYYYCKINRDIVGQQVNLSVVTSDETSLVSKTILPYIIIPTLETEGLEAGIRNRTGLKTVTFSWNPKTNVHLLFAKMIIPYYIISQNKYSQIEVPAAIAKRGDKIEYVYPSAFSSDHYDFQFPALDSALASIGRGIKDKTDIEVVFCKLSLRGYDEELSAYYSTTNGFLDQYSLRLDENTYSNITGGLGIFGSFSTSTNEFPFDPRYIRSFGYTYNYPH
ncbi:MAG: DUF4249 family protein, partial [Bacteroidota bacterium]|nr:DUF4249 family protein [Bacteroidota bacterium]